MDLGRGMPSKCAEADKDLTLPMDEGKKLFSFCSTYPLNRDVWKVQSELK